MRLILGCFLLWLWAALVVLLLHNSLTPWMPVTLTSITSVWLLVLILILFALQWKMST